MATLPHDMPLCRGSYTVSTAPRTRGDVLSVVQAPSLRVRVGKKCWAAFFGRNCECPGCPTFELAPGSQRSAVLGDLEGPFTVVHVRRGRWSARVTAVSIPDPVLVGLLRGKLRRLKDAARLSGKERAVVDLLLLGRQTREIATALGISERTVKFHVTNLLEKLAADSRLDLTRKLLLTTDAVP